MESELVSGCNVKYGCGGLLWFFWPIMQIFFLWAYCFVLFSWVKVKVKWSRYRPGAAQRVGRSIALLFHDRDTRSGWVVSSTSWPHFNPGKDPVPILQEAGWAPEPVWTGGKSRPYRDSIEDRKARSSVTILTELPGIFLGNDLYSFLFYFKLTFVSFYLYVFAVLYLVFAMLSWCIWLGRDFCLFH